MKNTDYPNSTDPNSDDYNPATPKGIFFRFDKVYNPVIFRGRFTPINSDASSRIMRIGSLPYDGCYLEIPVDYTSNLFDDSTLATFPFYKLITVNGKKRRSVRVTINDGSGGATTLREFWIADSSIKTGMHVHSFFVSQMWAVDIKSVRIAKDTTGTKPALVQDGQFKIVIELTSDTGQTLNGWVDLSYKVN
jgi:hypothetical protein